jgi:hypothetical protein
VLGSVVEEEDALAMSLRGIDVDDEPKQGQ